MTNNLILQHQPRLSLIKVKMVMITGIAASVLLVEVSRFFIGG